jgi:hypothetical protein
VTLAIQLQEYDDFNIRNTQTDISFVFKLHSAQKANQTESRKYHLKVVAHTVNTPKHIDHL